MTDSILITRPYHQAADIKEYLEEKNFTTFVEPIFEVEKIAINIEHITTANSIIVTSQNAADAVFETVKKLSLPKDITLYAVGKKTAELFLKAGFENVIASKTNSVTELKNLILDSVKPKDVLLYFCGEIISLDLQEEFAKYDITLEKIVSYRINPLKNFSSAFLDKIKRDSFDYITLYSKNSAKIFLELIAQHNLFELLHDSKILCLSENILDFIEESGFKNSSTFAEIEILKKFYE